MGRTRRDKHAKEFSPRGWAMRESLLDSLDAWLREVPLNQLTVKSVASEANTSPGTFYQYFKSLETALGALLDRQTEYVKSELKKRQSTPSEVDLYLVSTSMSMDDSGSHYTTREVVAQRVQETLGFLEEDGNPLIAALAVCAPGDSLLGAKVSDLVDALAQGLHPSASTPDVKGAVLMLLSVAAQFNSLSWGAYTPLAETVCAAATHLLVSGVDLP